LQKILPTIKENKPYIMCEKLKVAYKINTNEHDSDNRRYTDILLSRGKLVSNHINCYKVCFYYNCK